MRNAFHSCRGLTLPKVCTTLLVGLALGGCGSSSSSSSPSSSSGSAAPAAPGHGSVSVLYAGSLQSLMNTRLGPAFEEATGYSFNGYPAGSKDLANEIKGKVRQADVFISASPKVNATLEGSGNGNWVSWFAPFASTTLELGYNPNSAFAGPLRHKPWYRVITKSGFRLGFTDPKLDPKGVLAVTALDTAALRYHETALGRIATDQADLFPEQDLVGRLQAGQLDAGFFYTVEANAAKIPTVSLTPIQEKAVYTITILNRAPDQAGALAFVKFLLGRRGQDLLNAAGLTITASPRAEGNAVPAGLGGVIKASH